MPRKKKVTLQHIADELGLTIQTVSNGLRGKPGMSEQTRSEIIQTARRLGYYTREQQELMPVDNVSLYPTHRRHFKLLLSEASLNFNRLLLAGLHERFTEFGHTVEPLILPERLSAAEYERWIDERGIGYAEGIFIAPRIHPSPWESKLIALPVPRILLNYPPPETRIDSVVWDVREAMYQAVRHFIRQGHRRIMYVGDVRSQRGFALRWQTFQEAMLEQGVQVNPLHHAIADRDGADGWLRQFIRLYEELRPTAVLCGLDEETAEVYFALRALGIDIPRDCSLIGLLNEQSDKLPLFTRPMLPIREAGYRAADRMLWRIANPRLPYEHIRIMGDFTPGSTVSRLAQ